MSNDATVGVIWFTLIFILEYFYPFFKFPGGRIKHAFNNLSIALINTLVVFLFAGTLTICVDCFNQRFAGLLGAFDSNWVLKMILAIIIFDLWMYVWHRMNHEIHFLWRFHRMHHTDPRMDSSTAVRFHPIEMIFSYILNIIVLGLSGLNFAFLAIYKIFMFPVIILHHSNIALPRRLNQFLNSFIVMPSMHRVHHSEIFEETNSNYGSIFSFWDRMFKTYRTREDLTSIIFGIGAFKTKRWQGIPGMLWTPFKILKKGS